MKKVLAIVLTLAMLLSCMIVGLSAGQVISKHETENLYWSFTGGNAYNPIQTPNTADRHVLSFDLKFEPTTQAAHGIMSYGSTGAPFIDFVNKTIGVDTHTTAYSGTWEEGTWYNFVFDNTTADTVAISCDGVAIGSVSDNLSAEEIFGQWRDVSLDNIKTYNGDTVYFSQDFSDFTADSSWGQGALATSTSVSYTNVMEYEIADSNKYWQWDADNCYIALSKMFDSSSLSDQGVISLSFKIRLDRDDSRVTNYGSGDTANFVIDNEANKIGTSSQTVSYNFETGVWYNIKYDMYSNGASNVFVDNNLAGTIAGTVGRKACGGVFGISLDDLSITFAQSGVQFVETFDNGFDHQGDSNGFATNDVTKVSHDLGTKYGYAGGGLCGAIKIASSSKYDSLGSGVSFDVCFPTLEGAKMVQSAYVTPTLDAAAGKIGVGTDTLDYTFEANTWYTLNFDASTNHGVTSGTDIYVNGVKIGNVASRIGVNICPTFYNLKIDNILGYYIKDGGSVYRQTECNFEDGTCDIGMYTNFDIMDYVLEDTVKPIYEYFPDYEVGGEAGLIDIGYGNEYFSLQTSDLKSGTKNVAYNFDLALLPNTDTKDTYIELWSDGNKYRWLAGTTFAGCQIDSKTYDVETFDWGTPSITNFHNVTISFLQGTGELYVDDTLLYTGPCGSVWDSYLCMMIWGGSAIIDNFQMMATANVAGTQIKAHDIIPSNFVATEDVKAINLDAEDFCATNGHITGITTRTTAPTCHSIGLDTTACAVCGATAYTTDVAMTAHDWASYDLNRKTEEGLTYTYCQNEGCTEKRYTEVPAAGTYTGTVYEAYDMSDDMLTVLEKFSDTVTYDGVANITDTMGNYNPFNVNNGDAKSNNWSWSFDFTFTGTFDTIDTKNYGHELYFWVGGSNTIFVQAGYNADNHQLFIRPNDKSSFAAAYKDFTFVTGETYNFAIKYKYDTAAETAGVYLYVNGVEMVKYDTDGDSIWNLPYAADKADLKEADLILRDFGVMGTLDNMVIGTADYARTDRAYGGDLDGDYAITTADALAMRKYLAKVIGTDGLVTSRMDANNDGAVNAKDQLVIRKAIAGI